MGSLLGSTVRASGAVQRRTVGAFLQRLVGAEDFSCLALLVGRTLSLSVTVTNASSS